MPSKILALGLMCFVSVSQAKLADRLTIRTLNTTEDIQGHADAVSGDNPREMLFATAPLRPIQIRSLTDKTLVVGWTDQQQRSRITHLSSEGNIRDQALYYGKLVDFVAHDDGSIASLHFDAATGRFRFTKVDNGKVVFDIPNTTNYLSMDWHVGNVEWNGSEYGVYHGIMNDGHQGDTARIFSASGQASQTSAWHWACSHSIDLRVLVVGNAFHWMCNSDAFGPGIRYQGNTVASHWADAGGTTTGRIGGFAVTPNRVALAHSDNGAGMFSLYPRQGGGAVVQLRFTSRIVAHENIKMARLGKDQILISWREGQVKKRHFIVVNESGQLIGEEEILDVVAHPRSDFRTAPNGDVIWASAGSPRELKLMRIEAE